MIQRNRSHFLLVFSEKIIVGPEFLRGEELEAVVAKGIGTTTTRTKLTKEVVVQQTARTTTTNLPARTHNNIRNR